jgi:transcription antitermination protein NusB
MDPRHEERIKIVQNLFAYSYDAENELPHPKVELTHDIIKNLAKIDGLIQEHAPKYPIDRIAKTDVSILRLALYELLINPIEPKKVVINEAVELAKDMGNDRSYAFINAVLGSIVKEEHTQEKE